MAYSISAICQEGLLSLKQLEKVPIYGLDSIHLRLSLEYSLPETKLLAKNSNKLDVIKLELHNRFYDSIPAMDLDFPNLQELQLIKVCFIPAMLDYPQLQNLYISCPGNEYCSGVCNNASYLAKIKKNGYTRVKVSTDFIYSLKNLKYIYVEWLDIPYNYISEKIIENTNLERFDYSGWLLHLPVSFLQLKELKGINIMDKIYSDYDRSFSQKFLDEGALRYTPEYINLCSALGYDGYGDKIKKSVHRVPQTGKFKNYYKNGQKLVEGRFRNKLPDGKWLFWYDNGQINQERFYKNGVEDSVWTFWNEKGDTIRKEFFNEGHLETLEFISHDDSTGVFCKQYIYNYSNYDNRLEKSTCVKTSKEVDVSKSQYQNSLLIEDIYSNIDSIGNLIGYSRKEYEYNTDSKIISEYNKEGQIVSKEIRTKDSLKTIIFNPDGTIKKESIYGRR